MAVMKMPELLVFARMFVLGFITAETARLAFYLGSSFATQLDDIDLWLKIVAIVAVIGTCFTYAFKRDAHQLAARMVGSWRLDLLLTAILGAWSSELALPWLATVHVAFQSAAPVWARTILALLCTVLLSPLLQHCWSKPKKQTSSPRYIADDEITTKEEDLLESHQQAESFAEAVLAGGAHPGLIFGVDGPWGVGKTSFINLAERHWRANAKVIVCRFEPLRYASEPDLADRLIRDLSATIQSKVFAPEFRSATSRYSRLLKGKADISFLGFKLSLEPSQETIDELLDDIDDVLRRIDRRVIVVIDDIDRLDAKATNSVLFATRRTLSLKQATYVLCYDTEVLAGGKEEGLRAREFLEKFVTTKLSLFVDGSSIRKFLLHDWSRQENHLDSVPADTMIKLGTVLSKLANILDSDLAPNYQPFVGNLRKVKRFVNAMLLMQIEKTDLGRTDFNPPDLINLVLLHLNYPGLFRRIYAEETDGRSGSFSLRRMKGKFKNADAFETMNTELPAPAWFLLQQLFDARTVGVDSSNVDESIHWSRACFNSHSHRNLEAYLKLIVRFEVPEPQQTFALSQSAVNRVRGGETIKAVLASPDYALVQGERAHDQFWRVLCNQSSTLSSEQAEDAIGTIVRYLPRYSAFQNNDRGLRQRSIYSLLLLLENVGWGQQQTAASVRRPPNSAQNVVEIAWRLFGEGVYQGKGLLEQIASPDRRASR